MLACAVQITPVASVCLQHLATLLLEVCKNPMQPTFNHYLFESVAALIRHVASKDPSQVRAAGFMRSQFLLRC